MNMKGSTSDPFYAFKDDIMSSLDTIHVKFARLKDALIAEKASAGVDYGKVQIGIINDLWQAEKKLGWLKSAVDQIEKDRARFASVKDQELSQRKQFVLEMHMTIQSLKEAVNSEAMNMLVLKSLERGKMRIDSDVNEYKGSKKPTHHHFSVETEDTSETSGFLGDSHKKSSLLLKKQDEHLSSLELAATRLGNLAGSINDELKDQNRMLNKLDEEMDDAGNKLNFVTNQLSKLLNTKDQCQLWTVVILILIAAFLCMYYVFLVAFLFM